MDTQNLQLDPAIRNWVLIPIMVVMVLIGVLRHYITLLLQSPAKTTLKAIRENQALARGRLLRMNANWIPNYAFEERRQYLGEKFTKGHFLKTVIPEKKQNSDNKEEMPNPMGDPAQMDVMMDMMKKNMGMMVPQMLMMGWITYFFSGFVIVRLPFPLTLRFKSMLQRGIETSEMDVTWVSSLSWYFLNLFGLRGVFSLILGEDNQADGMRDMQQMAQPQQQMQQPQDVLKIFQSEKESFDLMQHQWQLANIEERLLLRLL